MNFLAIIPLNTQSYQYWNTLLPFESANPFSDLIELSVSEDSTITILSRNVLEEYSIHVISPKIIQFNYKGNLIQNKTIYIDTSFQGSKSVIGGWPQALISLPTNTFIIAGVALGEIKRGFYYHISNTLDSLEFRIDSTNLGIRKYDWLGNNIIFLSSDASGDINSIYNFEPTTLISEVLFEHPSFDIMTLEDSLLLTYKNIGINGYINILNESGDLLNENELNKRILGISSNYSNNEYLYLTEDSLYASNLNFEIIFKLSFKSLNPSSEYNRVELGEIIPTQDNGYLISGSTGPQGVSNEYWFSMLIKIDSSGEIDWSYAYSLDFFPFNIITQVVESYHGYILIGTNYSNGENWLVHINKNGLLSKSEVSSKENLEHFFYIYPNPVKDVINIQKPFSFNGYYRIYDIAGRLSQTGEINSNSLNQSILFNAPLPGVYFIKLLNENVQSHFMKIIIQ